MVRSQWNFKRSETAFFLYGIAFKMLKIFKVVKYGCKIFEEVDVIYLGEIRDSFDVKWCFACASLLVYA